MLGHRIWGKRLGIIGMGRIGQAVARRARAFGLQVHYHNRKKVAPQIEEELEATYWESLDQMLARMDIISVNCPHTPATYHLLSARRLKLMRPEAYIVNTARGEVIDENALTRMIDAGDIAGAGLDVFEHEPAVNPKLVKLARAGKVVILPHMGSATIEGRIDMGEKVIINIRTFMDGHQAAGSCATVHVVIGSPSCLRHVSPVSFSHRSLALAPAVASAQPMTVDEFRRELVGVPLCGTPELRPVRRQAALHRAPAGRHRDPRRARDWWFTACGKRAAGRSAAATRRTRPTGGAA